MVEAILKYYARNNLTVPPNKTMFFSQRFVSAIFEMYIGLQRSNCFTIIASPQHNHVTLYDKSRLILLTCHLSTRAEVAMNPRGSPLSGESYWKMRSCPFLVFIASDIHRVNTVSSYLFTEPASSFLNLNCYPILLLWLLL